MSIETWVTTLDGVYLGHLERTTIQGKAQFRRFRFSRELGGSGAGSLEYHLDNDAVRAHDDLFAFDNLVWMRYRGRTVAWLVEDRDAALDDGEHASDWVKVAGRGTRELIGDRIVWPSEFDEDHTDPLEWGVGGWKTTTDASATSGQKVVPVVSTVGASVGIPIRISGGGQTQLGIIDSIAAGVSVTLKDDLAFTFGTGSRVVGATEQWRRFVNRAAGEMLWDLIAESNPRFAAQIVRGTVETTGADGWTQDLRFDNLLEDVVKDVEAVHGDVEMEGLTFNYRNVQGVDRTGDDPLVSAVIFEEGADLLRVELTETVRDSLSWVVSEGTGEAKYAKLAPKEKPKRRTRKTPVKNSTLARRRAPEAPKKVEFQRVNFPIFVTEEETDVVRRREGYLDRKDVDNETQLDEENRAVLEQRSIADGLGLVVGETRYEAETHYGLGDWIRFIAPSLGADEDARIVELIYAENDDDVVRVGMSVNSPSEEHLLRLKSKADKTASSVGVRNRQPQGQLVPFPIVGAGPFDTDDTAEVHFWLPDELRPLVRCQVAIDFRQFSAPAKSAVSSGQLTSDSGGATTSTEDTLHVHEWAAWISDTPGTTGFASRRYQGRALDSTAIDFNLTSNDSGHVGIGTWGGLAHDHDIGSHTHTVPGHTHGLVFGIQKESYPGSHSVTLKVYELVDTTFTLRGTVSGLVLDREILDLLPYVTGAGQWMLTIQSAAAQPNGGRLFAHVSGHAIGAMQSA